MYAHIVAFLMMLMLGMVFTVLSLVLFYTYGIFRKKSASFHGQLAENAFEQFSFDKLFMGTDGIDLNVGVTTFN
ncbi:hypothetical protein ONQ87_24480, partial [Salmonella enterica subsp. enterica serovar Virginia]|nr:hypothetical protein [Salmonella enterica subsp. enterica serovar Virginia]